RHPLLFARFGLEAVRSASGLARARFKGERARALFAGIAAHSVLPLDAMASASFALVLGVAGHAFGWPLPRGGSRSITQAPQKALGLAGGRVVVGHRVAHHAELRDADIVLFDVSPRQLVAIGGERLPHR